MCLDTLAYNDGVELDAIDFDLENFLPQEAVVVENAKYARSKYYNNRFGSAQHAEGQKLKSFFATHKKRNPKESLGHPFYDEIDEKNEKMVAIIKEVNKELAEFIEREGQARASVPKLKPKTLASLGKEDEKQKLVLQKEIQNNDEIAANLQRELQLLKSHENRISREG